MNKTIVLVGFMGSGKSRLGAYAAKQLGLGFADTDLLVEKTAGMSIRDIFASQGEEAFRKLETETLRQCCLEGEMLLATGGGIVKSQDNLNLIRSLGGRIVWLKATPQQIYERLRNDETRPLLAAVQGEARRERIENMMNEREVLYRTAADLVFDEQGIPVCELGERFTAWLNEKIMEKD